MNTQELNKQMYQHFISWAKHENHALTFKQYLRRILDMRFKTSKELFNYAQQCLSYDKHHNEYLFGRSTYGLKNEIREIRKKRVRDFAPYEFTNIFDNPLVKDIKNNKSFITFISQDLVKFGWRNHWAKTPLDCKILIYYKNKLNKAKNE